MKAEGKGRGKVVPTGKTAPALEVDYEIGHNTLETQGPRGQMVQQKTAVVRSIHCEDQPIPLGDWDLQVGSEFLRLRHTGGDPEWLVLSSGA